jgi:hypothetical protein
MISLLTTRAVPRTVARREAAVLVQSLPTYQVALWPDGWELLADGAVRVRDTHAMAEARRWYALADRNQSREDARRVMTMHGIFVPRVVVDLAERRFASEQVASVALEMIAGDWVRQRRRQLLAAPEATMAVRGLGWTGSRYAPDLDIHRIMTLLLGLVRDCIAERLIPDADYGVAVRPEGGYGIPAWRCTLTVGLESWARERVREALTAALIPWNRAVVRDGCRAPVVAVEVRSRPPLW